MPRRAFYPPQRHDRIFAYFAQHAWLSAVVALFALLPNILHPYRSIFMGRVLDAAIAVGGDKGNLHLLLAASLTLVFTILGLQAMRFVGRTCIRLLCVRIEGDLRAGLVTAILHQPPVRMAHSTVGDMMSRAQSDVAQIGNAISTVIFRAGDGIVLLVANLVALCTIDWQLTLLAAIPLPVVAVLSHVLGKRLFVQSKAVQQAAGATTSRLQQLVVNTGILRLLGREESERQRYDEACETQTKRFLRLTFFQSGMGPGLGLLCGVGIILVLLLGGRHVAESSWTVGQFMAYLALFIAFADGAPSIIRVVTQLHVSGAAWGRVKEQLQLRDESLQPEMQTVEHHPGENTTVANKTTPCVETLAVQHLSFCFPGNEQYALQDISFTLHKGQTLGITGPVGCGKSALLLALTGLYPYEGSIQVDGQELRDIPEAQRLAHFGYAGHETGLFSDSLGNNIRFGRAADDTKLAEAIAISSLSFDIAHFDQGMDTPIGERGVKLSGGQRQRAALARSVYAAAPVQLWDDPFSAVDISTEATMLAALQVWAATHMLVLSTHRLTALTNASHILVLQNGAVIEQGAHNALMAAQGIYARIYTAQSKLQKGDLDNGMAQHKASISAI